VTSTRAKKKPTKGTVAFIGSGPGDPGLLTVRAADLIAAADVVLHDAAVPAAVLDRAHADAQLIAVDVDAEGAAVDAAERAKAIVEAAKTAANVVRLVVGDPVVDGALAAEGPTVAKAKLIFEVVPGVPSASAVPGYAGVPLLGGKSTQVHVIDVASKVDWSDHIAAHTTLVLLGAGTRIDEVTKELLAAGRNERTPIAITVNGTTTDQRTTVGTLDHVAELAKPLAAMGDLSDALVVIGDSVASRERLSWFETKPLFGWRVLVPRTREQAGALSDQLRGNGAIPVEVPTISVEPPRTPQQMERAIQGLVNGRYQWVAFTSANAVKAVREKFEEFGLDARAFSGLKVAAIGEATARALVAFGVRPDLVPSGEQSSLGLLADWPEYDDVLDPINRVFLPRADIATEQLVEGLTKLGWEVDDVTAYRTVRAAPPAAETREAIKTGGFDAVLFTSSSTVRNLIGIAGKPHASTVVACIGPQTAQTAEEHGLRVDVQPENASVEALADALAEFGEQTREAAIAAGETIWRPSERRNAKRKPK
jgi:uroporphyrinogen III methyltransferase / synthase